MRCPRSSMSVMSVLVSALITAFCVAGLAQSQSGLGRTPTKEEIRAWEALSSGGKETIKGRLIDHSCYMIDKSNTRVAHKGMSGTCATACAKKGETVALLTPDGKVYAISGALAANNNAKLVAHLSHTVEVTGDTMDHGGGHLMIAGMTLKMISK